MVRFWTLFHVEVCVEVCVEFYDYTPILDFYKEQPNMPYVNYSCYLSPNGLICCHGNLKQFFLIFSFYSIALLCMLFSPNLVHLLINTYSLNIIRLFYVCTPLLLLLYTSTPTLYTLLLLHACTPLHLCASMLLRLYVCNPLPL